MYRYRRRAAAMKQRRMSCSGERRGLNQKRGMRKTEQSKPPERIETIEIRVRKILKLPAGNFKKTVVENKKSAMADFLFQGRGYLLMDQKRQYSFPIVIW